MKVLLLFLAFVSVRLDSDVCQFLKSSDRSFRIGLYRRLSGDSTNSADTYYLFRRDEQSSTRMWEISFDRVLSEEFKVRLNGESVESIGANTTHAFSLEASDDQKLWNCSVVKEWSVDARQTRATTHCESSSKKISAKDGFNDELIFRGKPSDSSALNVVDKVSKHYKTLEVRNETIQFGTKNTCDSDKCTNFLTEMIYIPLRDRLESITDFNVGNSSGHLLLFNIKGQLKYCIDVYPYPTKLRFKCTMEHSEELLPLADHCYRSDNPFDIPRDTPRDTTRYPPRESDGSRVGSSSLTKYLLIIGFFVFLCLIVNVVLFFIVTHLHNLKHPAPQQDSANQLPTRYKFSSTGYPLQQFTQPTEQSTAIPTAEPSKEIETPVPPNGASVGSGGGP